MALSTTCAKGLGLGICLGTESAKEFMGKKVSHLEGLIVKSSDLFATLCKTTLFLLSNHHTESSLQ